MAFGKDMENPKNAQYYLSLPYRRIGHQTGLPGNKAYFMEVLEIEGCYAEGADYNDAYEALSESLAAHIDFYLRKRISPPLPLEMTKKYSGNIHLRMPSSLHCKLALSAKREGVSLNQLIIGSLSNSAARRD